MIRYAREKHIWVRTTTNASLLHLNDNYHKMIDADVNELQISVDGASKHVYEAIRRGEHYPRVMSNIALINDYARQKGVDRTKMWTVVQQSNLHELEALVDLAADLGFSNQVFSLELTNWGLAHWHTLNSMASAEQRLNADYLLGLVDRGETRGVRVRFWNTTAKYSTETPKTCALRRSSVPIFRLTSGLCHVVSSATRTLQRSVRKERNGPIFRRLGLERIFNHSLRLTLTATFQIFAAAVTARQASTRKRPTRALPMHRSRERFCQISVFHRPRLRALAFCSAGKSRGEHFAPTAGQRASGGVGFLRSWRNARR
jgi:MoaA/NifB/PqqE/SkfB family radical SAM enzyme